MRVMIQLQEDVALELQNQYGHPKSAPKRKPITEKLLNAIAELGVSLTPVHPGQTHPLLASHFMVETKDRQTAEQIISRLQQFDIVEAAYFRPDNEVP
jgi:hypothetical protein